MNSKMITATIGSRPDLAMGATSAIHPTMLAEPLKVHSGGFKFDVAWALGLMPMPWIENVT